MIETSLLLSIISIITAVINTLTLCHFKRIKSPCLSVEFFKSKSQDEGRNSANSVASDKRLIAMVDPCKNLVIKV